MRFSFTLCVGICLGYQLEFESIATGKYQRLSLSFSLAISKCSVHTLRVIVCIPCLSLAFSFSLSLCVYASSSIFSSGCGSLLPLAHSLFHHGWMYSSKWWTKMRFKPICKFNVQKDFNLQLIYLSIPWNVNTFLLEIVHMRIWLWSISHLLYVRNWMVQNGKRQRRKSETEDAMNAKHYLHHHCHSHTIA